MQCAGREGEFDPDILCEAHDLQKDLFTFFELGGVILDSQMEHDENIQTTVGEIIETHLEISFVRRRMIGDELFDAVGKRLQFFTRSYRR